jgi:hypothetical protein
MAPQRALSGLVTTISPPVAVCRRGLIELSTLFRNG